MVLDFVGASTGGRTKDGSGEWGIPSGEREENRSFHFVSFSMAVLQIEC